MIARSLLFAMACLCMAMVGCMGGQTVSTYAIGVSGNPRYGKQIIQAYGCGGCHIVPGIRQARGLVGPPLLYFSERTMIAGELPNTPDNLVRWVENPRAIEPKTAMPDLGLTPEQANDVAAYLYTLR